MAPPPNTDKTFAFDESAPERAAPAPSSGRLKTKLNTAKAGPGGVPVAAWVWTGAAVVLLVGLLGALFTMSRGGDKPAGESPFSQTKPTEGLPGSRSVQVEPIASIHQKEPAKSDDGPTPKGAKTERKNKVENAVGEVWPVKYPPGISWAVTSDDAYLIAIWRLNNVFKMQVRSGGLLGEHGGGGNDYSCLSIDPTGRLFAIGTSHGPIGLYSMESTNKVKDLSGHRLKGAGSLVTAVAFSPNGKRLLSAGLDYSVRQWDVENGQEISHVDQDNVTGTPRAVAFSPDGMYYVIGNSQANARVMSVAQNKEIARFNGHKAYVSCVAVAPDNRRVISGSWDKTVRVWEMKTGKELLVFDKHTAEVNVVAVSADGHQVISGGKDKVVRVWDLDTGQETCAFKGTRMRLLPSGL